MKTYRPRCAARSITLIVTCRFFFLLVALVPFAAVAQDIRKLDPEVDQLVASDAKLERIATGFDKWTEGPVWTHKGTLLFAEIPANNIDLWAPGKGASVFMHPSGYTGRETFKGPEPGSNGMTLDRDGRVSVAGHARRNVWRMESADPKAQITILADSYQGKKLNSPK
jgi:gluconolactonase